VFRLSRLRLGSGAGARRGGNLRELTQRRDGG
jgi:hypothetical protein